MITEIQLKELDWTFAKQDARPGRHKIHNYPATMAVPYVWQMLDIVKPTKVLDPFGGSGTVLFESIKRGIECWSNDLNPLATLIQRAKIQTDFSKAKELLDRLPTIETTYEKVILKLKNLEDFTGTPDGLEKDKCLKEYYEKVTGREPPAFKNLAFWFKPYVIYCLAVIKEALANDDDFSMVCFSECVRVVSNRRSREWKLYRIAEEDLLTYKPDVFATMKKILEDNLAVMQSDFLSDNSLGHIILDDAKNLDEVPDLYFDCVITSPPYGDSRTTVAYGQFSRLSLQWLDYEEPNVDNLLLGGKNSVKDCPLPAKVEFLLSEISKQHPKRAIEIKDFLCDFKAAFETIAKKTAANGVQFWVVGCRMIQGVQIPLDLVVSAFGDEYGFDTIASLDRNIPFKKMPKRNAPSNEKGKTAKTITEEVIVVIRKK